MNNIDFMVKVATKDRSIDVLRSMMTLQKKAAFAPNGNPTQAPNQQNQEAVDYGAIAQQIINGTAGTQPAQTSSKPAKAGTNGNPRFSFNLTPGAESTLRGILAMGGAAGGSTAGFRGGGWLGGRVGQGIGRGIGYLRGSIANRNLLNPGRFLTGHPERALAIPGGYATSANLATTGNMARTIGNAGRSAITSRIGAVGRNIGTNIGRGIGAAGGGIGGMALGTLAGDALFGAMHTDKGRA